jgi:hypothetical protein
MLERGSIRSVAPRSSSSYTTAFNDVSTGDFSGNSGTNPILALPFTDPALGSQSFISSLPGTVGGNVAVSSNSEMHSVALLFRRLYAENQYARIDVVGGYRYFRYREGLALSQDITTITNVGVFPANTNVRTTDRFVTENDFNGGELGVSAQMWDGIWTAEVLAKVALGNLRREAQITGNHTVTTGAASVQRQGGIYAQPSNIGNRHDDTFGVLPEIGININVALTDRMSATIGYTAQYLNDVFRSGDQISTRCWIRANSLAARRPRNRPSCRTVKTTSGPTV